MTVVRPIHAQRFGALILDEQTIKARSSDEHFQVLADMAKEFNHVFNGFEEKDGDHYVLTITGPDAHKRYGYRTVPAEIPAEQIRAKASKIVEAGVEQLPYNVPAKPERVLANLANKGIEALRRRMTEAKAALASINEPQRPADGNVGYFKSVFEITG